jgi:hypothetical protein
VRDLFKDAKDKAPCIIFIDELDAVGKNRAQGVYMGGNDERENTLNQLLTEMDGFDPQAGIIIMGATNRPEVLDPALLRPGRFDRQILVDRPDLKGRMDIFAVHTREFRLDDQVDFRKLAAETPGFAGAEIANVCNEAALLASRRNRQTVKQNDFQDAIERIIAGLEKKNKLINPTSVGWWPAMNRATPSSVTSHREPTRSRRCRSFPGESAPWATPCRRLWKIVFSCRAANCWARSRGCWAVAPPRNWSSAKSPPAPPMTWRRWPISSVTCSRYTE